MSLPCRSGVRWVLLSLIVSEIQPNKIFLLVSIEKGLWIIYSHFRLDGGIIPLILIPEDFHCSWASAISLELGYIFLYWNKKYSILCISSHCYIIRFADLLDIHNDISCSVLEAVYRIVLSMRKPHSYMCFCKINQRNSNFMKHTIQNRLIYFVFMKYTSYKIFWKEY